MIEVAFADFDVLVTDWGFYILMMRFWLLLECTLGSELTSVCFTYVFMVSSMLLTPVSKYF